MEQRRTKQQLEVAGTNNITTYLFKIPDKAVNQMP